MATRAVVQVWATEKANEAVQNVPLPGVFQAPLRPDVVQFVHTNIAKNSRQAYAVGSVSGMQAAAESWGTGRAVARIPRVNGGGTHRSGQATFGNQCRGGRMFSPTKIWRKWHRKVSVSQRRFALTSAVSATGVAPLVMARGHRIDQVAEIPLVLSNAVESIKKTKQAVDVLERHGAGADLERVKASRKLRPGKGKMRNRRYTQRLGPLIIYAKDDGITRAFRNIPGVDLVHVDRLNLLQLAPGGHLGRFVVWTQGAFARLDLLYGTLSKASQLKKDYHLPRPLIANADITRIINSDEVQSKLRAPIRQPRNVANKKNPLRNLNYLLRLNPHAKAVKRAELVLAEKKAARKKVVAEKRAKGQKTPARAKEVIAERKQRRANGIAVYNRIAAPGVPDA
jgi:large subunit ribosomal protein L4e